MRWIINKRSFDSLNIVLILNSINLIENVLSDSFYDNEKNEGSLFIAQNIIFGLEIC